MPILAGKKVAILGAGISGLATAYYCKKLYPEIELTVYEQSIRAGGIIKTNRIEGNIFECGARGIPLKGRGNFALDFIKEIGLWNQIVLANPKDRKRYIYAKGKLQLIPNNLLKAIFTSNRTGFLSAAFKDFRIKPSSGNTNNSFERNRHDQQDESLKTFSIRHFGEKATDHFCDPLLTGIMAGDMDSISLQAAFPQIYQLEQKYGSLIKGFLQQRKNVKISFDPVFLKSGILSFKNGMEQMISKLGEHLAKHILLDSKIKCIRKVDHQYQIQVNDQMFAADMIVSTIPAYSLANILQDVDQKLIRLLKQIEYTPIAIVHLWFKNRVNPYPGFGYLVASKEKQNILGATWNDQTFPEHHKTKGSCFTTMLGGTQFERFSEKTNQDFIQMAYSALQSHLGISQSPYYKDCKILNKAMPQYNLGHLNRIDLIHKTSPDNLIISGNFSGGIGISDILRIAQETANHLAKKISQC